MRGKIKKLIRDRGFGFINAENGTEVFFHSSALQEVDFDALNEGDSLEFNVETGNKGSRAVDVKRC